MPWIKFDRKRTDGWYLLATNGELVGLRGGFYWVSEELLEKMSDALKKEGVRYHIVTPAEFNADAHLEPKKKQRGRA